MDTLETFKLATSALKRNKSRSFLTMLGIIIGVFAVISLISVGTALKNYITKQFESIGANVLYVLPGQVGNGQGGFGGGGGSPNFAGSKLKTSYIKEIEKIGFPITQVTGDIEVSSVVKFKNKQTRARIVGGTPDIVAFTAYTLNKGRFFNNSEVTSSRKVAVIGSEIATKLYENKEPLGQDIIVAENRFKIIGVLESRGAGSLGSQDSVVVVPISSAQTVFGVTNLQSIFAKFAGENQADEAKTKIQNLLLKSLKPEDFTVINQGTLLTSISAILNVVTIALGGIAAISLLVGGIGIMNIMLVSVTERTREIGIRKSVGAQNSDILVQFLIEAIFLSLVGGSIGIIMGVAVTMLVGKLIAANAFSWWSIFLAIGVSSLVGIIFGVAPAYKASKLDPVEALRYE